VASDAQVARTTVYEYFEILKDTLLLHEIPAWRTSRKRKPLVSSKFYFFDVGVTATLQGRRPRPRTPEFGEALETYVLHELVAYRDYLSGEPIAHWRSASGFEVDFILGDHTAIEVKAKENIAPHDLKSLRAIAEEGRLQHHVCVSLDPRPRRVDGIAIVPVHDFLERLWDGRYA
jgi:predicted AAA+ superfamily ATPase